MYFFRRHTYVLDIDLRLFCHSVIDSHWEHFEAAALWSESGYQRFVGQYIGTSGIREQSWLYILASHWPDLVYCELSLAAGYLHIMIVGS